MIEELLESYLNGNIGYVREQMTKEGIHLGNMVDFYILMYNPDRYEVVLMVRRLG